MVGSKSDLVLKSNNSIHPMQFGHFIDDLVSLHSSGRHPQSAHLIA